MIFNTHLDLKDKHSMLSPSQSAWLRYPDQKVIDKLLSIERTKMGTRLHAWACETILLKIKQAKSKRTICAYINDALLYDMTPELVLKYSDNCFGTADTLCFDYKQKLLRIHDLKTGVTEAGLDQVKVYAALFCLEYMINPEDIHIELRIYQTDEVACCVPYAEEIREIMNIIIHEDLVIESFKAEGGLQ